MANSTTKTKIETAPETSSAPKVNMVHYKLPRIPGGSNQEYVSVNDESYLIRRGEDVVIPDYIAAVLDNSEREKEKFLEKLERMQNKENGDSIKRVY